MKRTLVLGASPNPDRTAYQAVERLARRGHEPLPLGAREGKIGDFEILRGQPALENVDTVTLYLGPERQAAYYDYIFSLRPKRIIFNPGAENPELEGLAEAQGIETVEGCTLVMLGTGQF